jgi:serine/threonine-protein kinase
MTDNFSSSHAAQENSRSLPATPMLLCPRREKANYYLLLRGLSLREELSKSGPLSVLRASEVLHGACTAVAAARQHRLLHRDIKPENIFLAKAGITETAKIQDFGVVKPIATADTTLTVGQTGPAMLVGALKYMSQE